MMQVDHVIARSVFNGLSCSAARALYGFTFTSADDLRNLVPSYGPLNGQKKAKWRPDEIVHLRAKVWRELKVMPPLGATGSEWTAEVLIRKGLAAAAAKAPIVQRELRKRRLGEDLEHFAELSRDAQAEVLRRVGGEPGRFPVIPAYEAGGVVRASLPLVEATVYLPTYPRQHGFGLIRFARRAIREVLILPDHAQLMRMLQPGRGLSYPVPGDDEEVRQVQFGPVSIRLRVAERHQLQTLLDTIRDRYFAALQGVEVEMLRASHLEYGSRGYRILRMSPAAWLELTRFAQTAPEGDGPHAPWRLERATETTLRVVSRHEPAGSLAALAVLTSEWRMPDLPPTSDSPRDLRVALAWHPDPPRSNRIDAGQGGPFAPGGLWNAGQVHDWVREALVPGFAKWYETSIVPSGRIRALLQRLVEPLAAPVRHVDTVRLETATAPSRARGDAREVFTSVEAYRAGIRAIAPRVSPGGHFLHGDAVIGLYIHISWLLSRVDPDDDERRRLAPNLRYLGANSLEEAVEAWVHHAVSHPPNPPAVQFALAALHDLLGMRPRQIPVHEVLENARRHVYPLFLAANVDAAWSEFASRPW